MCSKNGEESCRFGASEKRNLEHIPVDFWCRTMIVLIYEQLAGFD